MRADCGKDSRELGYFFDLQELVNFGCKPQSASSIVSQLIKRKNEPTNLINKRGKRRKKAASVRLLLIKRYFAHSVSAKSSWRLACVD